MIIFANQGGKSDRYEDHDADRAVRWQLLAGRGSLKPVSRLCAHGRLDIMGLFKYIHKFHTGEVRNMLLIHNNSFIPAGCQPI